MKAQAILPKSFGKKFFSHVMEAEGIVIEV